MNALVTRAEKTFSFILIIGFGSMPSDSPTTVCHAVNGVTFCCLFIKSQAFLDMVANWINDY